MAPPTASTSSASLHLVPVRRATFHKSRKAAATKPLNWPYPLTGAAAKASSIHPDRLADAGFFATPTRDDPTVTTCFLCDVVIGEWEEGEDPLYRHQAAADEAGIRCGWVTVLSEAWDPDALDSRAKDGWDELWGDEGELHPRGGRMGAAREHTFRLGWPHDDEEGVPTKEEIAAAGWYFRPGPTEESADQCACLYCGRTVEGWEEGDDPVALHKRKVGLKCPFFLAPDLRPASSSATTGPAAKGKKKPKASKAAPPPVEDEADEVEAEEPAPEPAPAKPKRGKKASTASAASVGSAALKKSTRGRAKAPVEEESAADVAQEETSREEEDDEEEAPIKPTRGKKVAAPAAMKKPAARATRSKTTPAPSEAEDEVEVPILKKSTRSRAASNASTTASAAPPPRAAALSKARSRPTRDADLSVEVEVKANKKSSAAASKKSKKAPAPEPEPAAQLADADADEDMAQLAAIADLALEAQAEPEPEVEPTPAPKAARTSSKAKKASSSVSSVAASSSGKGKKVQNTVAEEEVVEGDVESPAPAVAAAPQKDKVPTPPLAVPPGVASNRSPFTPTVSPGGSRPIRSLPTKAHASKSPTSTSLKATPVEPAPPLPAASASAPASVAVAASVAAKKSAPLPSTAAPTPAAPTTATSTSSSSAATPAVDPSQPWSPPPNPFASTASLLSLLPPPTPTELSTHTVSSWYALCASRLEARFEAEAHAMRAQLEARIAAGRERLEGMERDAREREERSAEERERRRRDKKEKKGVAGAAGRSASKPRGVAGSATRKMR